MACGQAKVQIEHLQNTNHNHYVFEFDVQVTVQRDKLL